MNNARQKISIGLAFLAPNILGFLFFTIIPLGISLMMAFTNWDLRYHNQFHREEIQFIGFENFTRLFQDTNVWRYFQNTLFMMMGIPLAICGSLIAALLLHKSLGVVRGRYFGIAIAGMVLFGSLTSLVLMGFGDLSTGVLIVGIGGLIFFGGMLGGNTVFRTLFYAPHFTAGVATFVLWKKLYNPKTGPINLALEEPLSWFQKVVLFFPPQAGGIGLFVVGLLLAGLIFLGTRILRKRWKDAEIGNSAVWFGFILLGILCGVIFSWLPVKWISLFPFAVWGFMGWKIFQTVSKEKRFMECALWSGVGGVTITLIGFTVLGIILIGLGKLIYVLPVMAMQGFHPPSWLTDYEWAKPALIFMHLWAAIGSNNMILYLAGLSNVPEELEEAAKIDGASHWQRFWAVTWPQLAPVTFFISIMSVIHGLQGGFEMARVMTKGGPAGSTTTLSYYIYMEGFETGRLGYASAVAWVLFLLVMFITLINWRFGGRNNNE